MTLNHLLLWFSAKGKGSWPQFRSAVGRLNLQQAGITSESDSDEKASNSRSNLPLHQEIRLAMERLGHVEFFTEGAKDGWRIVPPVAAFLIGTPARALLCGARSTELLDKIHSLADIDVSETDIEGGPSRILLHGPSQDVVAAHIKTLGILVQKAASTAILSVAPNVHDSRHWQCLPMPESTGWTVRRFSESKLRWFDIPQEDAMKARNGLFEFVMGYQRFHFLLRRGDSYRVPGQVGKYAVVRKHRNILNYDINRRTLAVRAAFRPPPLIERALVLCSGQNPDYDPEMRCLKYVEVPQEAARLAAQLLHQEVL